MLVPDLKEKAAPAAFLLSAFYQSVPAKKGAATLPAPSFLTMTDVTVMRSASPV
ncbi:hypothetical protein Rahaq2_2299 [Rahnella aquatilis CIP 78.65 = ATCC 33071]|uniref:Uncharacterized protein n=1 Tax=Rahnella aquatilis (strain ATCC 33071 / DSM 4594 / JCM 1683 / NBRC 105701 / NCIMB 13365 / CIP 78.65) TaxID=745277 RepID=H2IZG7_RAHAC|nr:hypothetical protein Rahaq2_2299 [Rahnella aquatilis CIP 78.65 = ATCC 33071]